MYTLSLLTALPLIDRVLPLSDTGQGRRDIVSLAVDDRKVVGAAYV
jgi:hypothetical protein